MTQNSFLMLNLQNDLEFIEVCVRSYENDFPGDTEKHFAYASGKLGDAMRKYADMARRLKEEKEQSSDSK